MKTAAIPVLAVLLVLTGASGCSRASGGKTLPSPATAAAKQTASPATRTPDTDDMRAARRAAAALVPGDGLTAADTITGGQGSMNGFNRDDNVKKGLRLVIAAACVGTGTVTFTATSGSNSAHQMIPCGVTPEARSFEITTDATRLDVERRAGKDASGGSAYVVRAGP